MRHSGRARGWLWLGLVVLLGLGLRLGRWSEERQGPQGRAPAGDEGTYDRWALRLVGSAPPREVPYMAPLQAWSLAAWHAALPPDQARDAQRLLQVALGAGTALLAGLVGRRLGGPRVGLVAAAAVALHLPLVYYEPTLLRDGPAAFLCAGAGLALVRLLQAPTPLKGLVLGLVSGLGALCRENLLLVSGAGLGLLLLWALRAGRREVRASRAAAVLAAAAGLVVPLLPLLSANAALEGRWNPLPTWNGGCVFYLSNRAEAAGATYHPPPFVRLATPEGEQAGFRAEAERQLGRSLTPHEVSSYWLERGLREVAARPLSYLRRVATRAVYYLAGQELVHARDLRLDREDSRVLRLPGVGFGVLAAFALLGGLGARHRLPVRGLVAVCLLLLLTTVVVAFSSRYRLPAVPLLAPLAALGAREATLALRRGRPGPLLGGVALALLCTWIPVPYTAAQRCTGRLNRALTWMELGEPERAFAEMDRLPAGTTTSLAWRRLGELLRLNGEGALADAAFSRALGAGLPAGGPAPNAAPGSAHEGSPPQRE